MRMRISEDCYSEDVEASSLEAALDAYASRCRYVDYLAQWQDDDGEMPSSTAVNVSIGPIIDDDGEDVVWERSHAYITIHADGAPSAWTWGSVQY